LSVPSGLTVHQDEGPGTLCVVQVLAPGDVLAVIVSGTQKIDIAILVPHDNFSNVRLMCEGVAELGLAVAHREPHRLSFRISVYRHQGDLPCSKGFFTVKVYRGRGIALKDFL
jgi:hypothetical protein